MFFLMVKVKNKCLVIFFGHLGEIRYYFLKVSFFPLSHCFSLTDFPF